MYTAYNVCPFCIIVLRGGPLSYLADSVVIIRDRARYLSGGRELLLEVGASDSDVWAHGGFGAHGLYNDDLKVKPLILVMVAVVTFHDSISEVFAQAQ